MRTLFEFICWLILLTMLIIITTVHAASHKKIIRVGVIDTGLDLEDPRFIGHLCYSGHSDFTGDGIQDDMGHGTHIVGLITKYARNSNYCLVILKYYGKNLSNVPAYQAALREAIHQHLDVVNLSLNGPQPLPEEKANLYSS